MIGACTRTFLLRPSLTEAWALPLTPTLSPQAGRGGPKRRDTRPSCRLRGEGARRMRGGPAATFAHGETAWYPASPSRGEVARHARMGLSRRRPQRITPPRSFAPTLPLEGRASMPAEA